MTSHVDGNALAGPLSELFSADMTCASCRCASCGDVADLAEAMVYQKPNTYIVRCHRCGAMLLTIIQGSHRTRLELSGVAALSVPRPGT
ncbi:DUF6510 family protein [Galbitalea soli]|uniref:Uncharacterized protein n=1 Tax=Galbitalea soli TaxID=1268042 RepID=A0A7C9TMB7_9MICO|nr:DUF6510 family protein [Galbitalea soli]NEM89756.1 hypothetical protein [Galbitalea soli]NYJ30457.1 ribosomal protein S27E [Galbitalea soli]